MPRKILTLKIFGYRAIYKTPLHGRVTDKITFDGNIGGYKHRHRHNRAENYTLFRGKQEHLARMFIVFPKTLTSESKKPKKENPTKSPSVPPSSATWIHLVMLIFSKEKRNYGFDYFYPSHLPERIVGR